LSTSPPPDTIGQIDAIGADEIQYAKGSQVSDAGLSDRSRRHPPLCAGRQRTIESFRGFFKVIGDELASNIVFV